MYEANFSLHDIDVFSDAVKKADDEIRSKEEDAQRAKENTDARLDSAIKNGENSIFLMYHDIMTAEYVLDRNKKKLDELYVALERQKQIVAVCEKQLSSAHKMLSEARNYRSSIKSPSSTGNAEADAQLKKQYQQAIKNADTAVSRAKKVVENASSALTQAKKVYEQIKDNIDEIKKRIEYLEGVISSLQNKKADYERSLDSLRIGKDSLNKKYKSFSSLVEAVCENFSYVQSKAANARSNAEATIKHLAFGDYVPFNYDYVRVSLSRIDALKRLHKTMETETESIKEKSHEILSYVSEFRGQMQDEITASAYEIVSELCAVNDTIVDILVEMTSDIEHAYSSLYSYLLIKY